MLVLQATQPLLQQVDQLSRQLAAARAEHDAQLTRVRDDVAATEDAHVVALSRARERQDAAEAAADAAGRRLAAAVEAREEGEQRAEVLEREAAGAARKLQGCEKEREALLEQLDALRANKQTEVEARAATGLTSPAKLALLGE
jgi:chromosome segregation ATPase